MRALDTTVLVGFDGFIDTILQVVDQRQSATEYTRVPTLKVLASASRQPPIKAPTSSLSFRKQSWAATGRSWRTHLRRWLCDNLLRHDRFFRISHEVFHELAARAEMCLSRNPPSPMPTNSMMENSSRASTRRLPKSMSKRSASASALMSGAMRGKSRAISGMVNWTMLPHHTEVWRRIQTDFPGIENDARKTLFFDLADPEKRTPDDIAEALETLSDFGTKHDVVLGLNEKEGLRVAEVLGLTVRGDGEERIASLAAIFGLHSMSPFVWFTRRLYAGAASRDDVAVVHGPFTSKPKISTGAGDHFNAGFCCGLLAGGDLETALQIGAGTSGLLCAASAKPVALRLSFFLRSL
jgi:hypothetical protein